MADNNSIKLQEGVQVSQAEIKSEGQIKRTTAAATALLALALYAGSPAPAKAETPTDNKAVATFVVNAEYEAIIATAKKEGKNPLEYAKAKKEGGVWTMKDYIGFSKYNRQLQDQVAIEVKSKIDTTVDKINETAMNNLRMIAGIYSGDSNIFSKRPEWKELIYDIYSNQKGYYKTETIQYVIANFSKVIPSSPAIAMNSR